jgi:hypothetical protein
MMASGIPISHLTLNGDINRHFVIKFHDQKYIQKPELWQNVRSILFSCVVTQLNIISFRMDDILIDKC